MMAMVVIIVSDGSCNDSSKGRGLIFGYVPG